MTKRVLVAILGSFPVAVVAGVSLGLAINVGGAISTLFFWMIWGASTYYAMRETESRRVFGRTAVAYTIAGFSLPFTAAVFAVTAFGAVESSMSEAEGALEAVIWGIFGTALLEIYLVIAAVVAVFGVVTGIVAVLLARRLLRRADTEARQSTGLSVPAALERSPYGNSTPSSAGQQSYRSGLGIGCAASGGDRRDSRVWVTCIRRHLRSATGRHASGASQVGCVQSSGRDVADSCLSFPHTRSGNNTHTDSRPYVVIDCHSPA